MLDKKQTSGSNSPIIDDTEGDVNITYNIYNVPIDDSKIPKNILEILDKELVSEKSEKEEYKRKYLELLEKIPEDDKRKEFFEQGNLDEFINLSEQKLQKVKQEEAELSYQIGQAYELKFDNPKALIYLEKAYNLQPENILYSYKYADMLRNQGYFKESIFVFENNINKIFSLNFEKPEVMLILASSFNSLGILLWKLNDFKNSEIMFEKALNAWQNLSSPENTFYLEKKALMYNNIGNLKRIEKDLDKAEYFFNESISIIKKISKNQEYLYYPDLALSLLNLGVVKKDKKQYKESEKLYLESLELYRKLSDKDLLMFTPHIASVESNLGNLYIETQDFKQAEFFSKSALKIREILSCQDERAYLADFAMSLVNLANVYFKTKRLEEAKNLFTQAFSIFKKLYLKNPSAYKKYLEITEQNLKVLEVENQENNI
jgi:tetratricopeptide (TPR) repeat protein